MWTTYRLKRYGRHSGRGQNLLGQSIGIDKTNTFRHFKKFTPFLWEQCIYITIHFDFDRLKGYIEFDGKCNKRFATMKSLYILDQDH